MDTNSNIPAQKKVVSVEILHLDELGYGPNGSMTREAWRNTCLEHLTDGKVLFKSWQLKILAEHKKSVDASFASRLRGEERLTELYERYSSVTLDFVGLNFSNVFDFREFEFLLPCNFCYAKFCKDVWFGNVIFSQDVWFDHVVFYEDAWFENVIFEAIAWFRLTEFNDDAWFAGVKFNGDATFLSADFKHANTFKNAEFKSSSNFQNTTFKKVGLFEEAFFKTLPPSFRGVDIATTRLEFSNDYYFPTNSNTQQAIDDISFLKRLSDENGQYDQALNFNALELKAKRKLSSSGLGFNIMTLFYEIVSDFGRSFVRPLVSYAILLIVTLGLSFEHAVSNTPPATQCPQHAIWWNKMIWVEGTENCPSEAYQKLSGTKKDKEDEAIHLSGFRAAFEYTLYRSSGILDFSDNDKRTAEVAQRLFGQTIEPNYMRIWGVFKAIASTALLFLAALGLRNKYRIK